MSLRCVVIFLPLYYSTILISMFATISTHIPSYKATNWCMPLHLIIYITLLIVAKVQYSLALGILRNINDWNVLCLK